MKTLIALTLSLAAATAAQADAGLTFVGSDALPRTEASDPKPNSPALNLAVGSFVKLGQLVAQVPGTLTFTYLGEESGYSNGLRFAGQTLTEASQPRVSSISGSVAAGVVPFEFFDSQNGVANNLSGWLNNTSIGLVGTNLKITNDTYQFVLGFNDGGGSALQGDWDDYVVGVNFTAVPVPEPGSVAMMFAGLAAVGLFLRSRRQR